VLIEIGMHPQKSTSFDSVQPAPEEVWIGHKALDPRQVLEELEKWTSIQLSDQLAREWSHSSLIIGRQLQGVSRIRV